MKTIELENVAADMRESVRVLASLLQDLSGSAAKSLTMFGSVVGDEFDRSQDTARSVLVVERVDLGVLGKLALEGARLGKMHLSAPLIMTPDYIEASRDTFPLELLEIHQKHATVFGEDSFDALTFAEEHVRLQCERELKSILIGLRQGLLAAAGREKFLTALILDAGQALSRTLRGLAWLKGDHDAQPIDKVMTSTEKRFDRKLPGVRAAMSASAQHDWDEFEALYKDIEALGKVADDL